jgi:hypothetical protein
LEMHQNSADAALDWGFVAGVPAGKGLKSTCCA